MIGLLLCFVTILSVGYAYSSENEKIDQLLIEEINNSQDSWIAGVNEKFNNLTLDQIKSRFVTSLKANKDVIEKELPLLEHDLSNLNAPPTSYDARKSFPQCASIARVSDQAGCIAGWALASSGVMTDRICIKSNGQSKPQVSAQDLVSCCFTCGLGCKGGMVYAAYLAWNYTGIVSGGDYGDKSTCSPYFFDNCAHNSTDGSRYQPCPSSDEKTPKCTKICQNGVNYENDKSYGSAYRVGATESQIVQEIFTNGPVTATMIVYEDFLKYKSGIYRNTTITKVGYQSVKIIGWGLENKDKYWLAVNSWNEDWGIDGTFKILKGVNNCGIEDEVVSGLPTFKSSKDKLQYLK